MGDLHQRAAGFIPAHQRVYHSEPPGLSQRAAGFIPAHQQRGDKPRGSLCFYKSNGLM